MRDLFFEDGLEMSSGTETIAGTSAAQDIRDALSGAFVCPFCGSLKERSDGACPRCTMENTPATRQATKARIGPWYVLQTRNPAAPGMKFETLLTFIRKGRIKPRSIVRGPTTHQLWRFAAHVKGLSREFGVCYSCGGPIEKTANICPTCNRLQEPPVNPDMLLESADGAGFVGATNHQPIFKDLPLSEDDADVPPRIERPAAPPVAIAGATKKPGDGFLSAKDLAAAFKLNTNSRADGPPRHEPGNHSTPRMKAKMKRQRRYGRYVFVLILLASGGTFAYLCHRDPVLWARTQAYYHQAETWVKQQIAAARQRPPKAQPTTAPAPTTQESVPEVAVQPEPAPQPAAQAQPQEPPVPPRDKTTETKPLFEESDQSQPREPIVDDLTKAHNLYSDAIDAEQRQDWPTAIKKYEQIKKLPHDVWPRDVDLRLKNARQQAQ